MLYFDSLVHVTSDGKWISEGYDASLEQLLKSLSAVKPVKACVVGLAGQKNMSNKFILKVCKQNSDMLVPVASLDPTILRSIKDARDHVAALSEEGFKGVKLHPRISKFDLSDERLEWVMKVAGEYEFPIFLCTFLRGAGRDSSASPVHLIYKLLIKNQNTKCILLHGGTTDLLALSDVVRSLPNTLLDLSFTLCRYKGSSLDADLQYVLKNLDQKCTIGSDFPEYSPSESKKRALALMAGFPVKKVNNVLNKNLASFLM